MKWVNPHLGAFIAEAELCEPFELRILTVRLPDASGRVTERWFVADPTDMANLVSAIEQGHGPSEWKRLLRRLPEVRVPRATPRQDDPPQPPLPFPPQPRNPGQRD